jgi:4-alpha-glucanotransferase
LWRAFRKASATNDDQPAREHASEAVDAAIAFTAQSPAPLALIPVEDILGLTEQPNVPGTIDEHPNWRRRLDAPASEILDAPKARARLASLRGRRT